jgi:hypothetical protein
MSTGLRVGKLYATPQHGKEPFDRGVITQEELDVLKTNAPA